MILFRISKLIKLHFVPTGAQSVVFPINTGFAGQKSLWKMTILLIS